MILQIDHVQMTTPKGTDEAGRGEVGFLYWV